MLPLWKQIVVHPNDETSLHRKSHYTLELCVNGISCLPGFAYRGNGCSQLLAALWLITFGSNIDCKIQNKLNILSFCNLMWNIGFLASSILVTDPTEFAKIHTLFFFLFQTSLLRKCAVLNLSVSSYGSSYMCREAPVNIRRHARTHSFSDSCLRVFRWFSSTFKTSDGQLHDSSGTYALPRIKTGLRIKS